MRDVEISHEPRPRAGRARSQYRQGASALPRNGGTSRPRPLTSRAQGHGQTRGDAGSRDGASSGSPARRHGVRLRRVLLLGGFLTLVYAALTLAVLRGTLLADLDVAVLRWRPAAHWPELEPLVNWWVLLGQRAIVLALAVLWLLPRTIRDRDLRPLVTLGLATLLVNVTVGLVKYGLGRLGPLQLGPEALVPGGGEVFADGTIFPSGHTANAVVTWGVLAYVACRHRRFAAGLAVFLSVTVGLTTVYLGTHWVSDVLAGWIAGGLVLLAVHLCWPLIERSKRWPTRYRQPVPAGPRPAAWSPTVRHADHAPRRLRPEAAP